MWRRESLVEPTGLALNKTFFSEGPSIALYKPGRMVEETQGP